MLPNDGSTRIAEEFWSADGQWARLAPLLPSKPRGVQRVDDRRVISGIIHVLKSGGRWVDAPARYGPRKTLYNRFVRWAAKARLDRAVSRPGDGGRSAGSGAARLSSGQGASVCQWRQRGERSQAIGRSRGGRTTKIHALTDDIGRPLAFVLTGGQVADCRAGARLLRHLPTDVLVHADKGYDTDRLRRLIETGGSVPNIPPRSHRRWKNCFSPYLYRGRNAIERMFGRLKDFRRVATRYDRLAKNYLSAVCLAATGSYWL